MLSDDKISHLSHVILNRLYGGDVIDIIEDEVTVRRAIKRVIASFVKEGVRMDEAVRKKIASMQRHVIEGTPEWDAIYQRLYREEEARRGLSAR